MSRHKNQLRDTKLTDIQINYWIKNGQTYKSTTDYNMSRRISQWETK